MTQRPAEASVQRRTTHWLERLGHFGKSRPLLAVVSAVGAALVLVLALFGVRALVEAKGEKAALATKSPAASSLAALPTDAAPTASPSKPAPLASEGESPSEADAPDAVSPPASAQSNRAAEDASAKEVDASGTKTSADVTAAVNHLRAGRYVEARAAYLELAAQEPTNDAYAAAARMLSLRIGSQCSGANVSARCPEIKP